MSTQVDVSRGGPPLSTIHVVTTGCVAPLSPSIEVTTSYATPNGVIRVERTERRGEHPRFVPPARMIRIQRVTDELVSRDPGLFSARKPHRLGHARTLRHALATGAAFRA